MRKVLLGVAVVLACAIMTGCATSRGVMDVSMKIPPNPESGPAVKIVSVTDGRQFQAAPRDPSTPSLSDRDIENKALTSRAIARKRNAYGRALGDILLPEGDTVEALVRDALTRSFRESGYRVVEEGKATPVEAEIEQFWAWFTPGFWTTSLEFEARVKVKGELKPLAGDPVVRGYVILHTQAAGTWAWMNIMRKGLENFVEEFGKKLGSGE